MAHRGASHAAPENTVEAFRLARELGADWVELDARLSADGVVVVHHDAHLADGRMLAELTIDEMPDSVPSLAEALEACDGMGVNIEVKNLPDDPDYDADHAVVDAVAGLAQAYLGPERTLISSFNMDSVDRMHRVDPSLPCAWLFFQMTDPASVVAGGRPRDVGDPPVRQPRRRRNGAARSRRRAARQRVDGRRSRADGGPHGNGRRWHLHQRPRRHASRHSGRGTTRARCSGVQVKRSRLLAPRWSPST